MSTRKRSRRSTGCRRRRKEKRWRERRKWWGARASFSSPGWWKIPRRTRARPFSRPTETFVVVFIFVSKYISNKWLCRQPRWWNGRKCTLRSRNITTDWWLPWSVKAEARESHSKIYFFVENLYLIYEEFLIVKLL